MRFAYILALIWIVSAPARANRADRLQKLREDLSGLTSWTIDAQTGLGIRDHTFQARFMLALGQSPVLAEKKMNDAFSLQMADGGFPSTDPNTVEFTMFSIGPIFLRYGSLLDSAFKASAMPHLRAAVKAIQAHPVRLDYTNIYLMKTVNLMLLGEALNDDSTSRAGYAALEAWLAQVRDRGDGIGEYDSPNYSGVQMMVLETGYDCTRNAAAKSELKRAMDYLWADVAANFFAGSGRLSGPQSRNYDPLFGSGEALDLAYYREGLKADLPAEADMPAFGDRGTLAVNGLEGVPAPADSLLALAAAPERIVVQRFGPGVGNTRFEHPGQDRYNYVTPGFAIGGVGAVAGTHQDRLASCEFASAKNLPAVVVFPRAANPYVRGHAGFTAHADVLFTSVQTKGALLILQDGRLPAYPGALTPDSATTISPVTSVVLPLGVDAAMRGNLPVTLAGATMALAPDEVLGLREGDACLAVRVFRGAGISFLSDGTDVGAGRIAIQDSGRVGIFMLAGPCATPDALAALVAKAGQGSAKITQSETGAEAGNWSVKLEIDALTLEASLGTALNYRRVNGVDAAPNAFLTVNGQALGTALLSEGGVAVRETGWRRASSSSQPYSWAQGGWARGSGNRRDAKGRILRSLGFSDGRGRGADRSRIQALFPSLESGR